MAWSPPPNDLFYRVIVRCGLLLRRIFRIRIISSGTEHLPPAGPRTGTSRSVVPGSGAVFAVTHFGYVDFAAAELMLWKHSGGKLRFLVHQGAADHWLAGATGAYGQAKRLVRGSVGRSYEDGLDDEARTIGAAFETPDARARVAGFLARSAR